MSCTVQTVFYKGSFAHPKASLLRNLYKLGKLAQEEQTCLQYQKGSKRVSGGELQLNADDIVESELKRTQVNKNTSFHLGQLKAKLAKLKRELLTPAAGGGGGAGVGFDVARTGVASVGFVGFPSVGKSTLMSKLTGTHSEAAAYEFTTLTTVPGVLQYNGAKIQILDLPGIIEGAKDGKGRGRQVIAVARTCSLIFIVLDVLKPLTHKRIIESELEGFGIRLNRKAPNISIKKKEKGGINMTNTVPLSHLTPEEVKAVLSEYKISNADVSIRCDATVDDLIDVIEGNRWVSESVTFVL